MFAYFVKILFFKLLQKENPCHCMNIPFFLDSYYLGIQFEMRQEIRNINLWQSSLRHFSFRNKRLGFES